MTAGVASPDICRITVVGPDGQADLAIPMGTTVSALLPDLLRHTTRDAVHGHVPDSHGERPGDGSWVLQRLGEPAFDAESTPESLDWLEGERFYLRRVENPLPELDFDDLADGIADSVQQRWDRWRPDYRRPMFLVLSGIAVTLLAVLLLGDGPTALRAGAAGACSALLLASATSAARVLGDSTLALLGGLAGCVCAGIAGACWLDGVPGTVRLTTRGFAGACAMALLAALVLLAAHLWYTRRIPMAPFLAVGVAAALGIVGVWLCRDIGLQRDDAAAIGATVLLGVVIFAPKIAIKAARLRGPQLPKTAAELSFDIEPVPPDEARAGTALADQYLSVTVGCASLAMVFAFLFLVWEPGWGHWCLAVLLAAAMLLRSRGSRNVWQRCAVAGAGTAGAIMLALLLWHVISTGWQTAMLLGVLFVLGALVAAALRPPPRRLLPIWEHIANILDTLMAIATVVVLGQVLGLYSWALGLFG